jgi:hypothetical protein
MRHHHGRSDGSKVVDGGSSGETCVGRPWLPRTPPENSVLPFAASVSFIASWLDARGPRWRSLLRPIMARGSELYERATLVSARCSKPLSDSFHGYNAISVLNIDKDPPWARLLSLSSLGLKALRLHSSALFWLRGDRVPASRQ